jgi:outer membrane protein OmpA-like peptidoglycan-associated protein
MLAAGMLAGCSTTPKENTLLNEARANYSALQNDPRAAAMAPVEFKQATDALHTANNAWQDHADQDEVTHLAYLAKQRAAIAQEVINRKSADQSIEQATRERDQLRLSARDQELAQAQQRSQQLESQLHDLSVKQTQRGTVVTLSGVLFNTGQAQLKPGSTRSLEKLADALRRNPNLTVSVEGHTDNTGSAEHNEQLSERRAEAVRTALAGMGVDPSRIKTRGFGEEYPVASNTTAAGRQLNRRVEVVISGAGQGGAQSTGSSGAAGSSGASGTMGSSEALSPPGTMRPSGATPSSSGR